MEHNIPCMQTSVHRTGGCHRGVRIAAASLTPHYGFCCALRLSSPLPPFRAVGVESLVIYFF